MLQQLPGFCDWQPRRCLKIKDGSLMPEEAECHLRRKLYKRFSQPECPRSDVFYVDPEGKYLPMIVDGVRQEITGEGRSWLRRFRGMQQLLGTPWHSLDH